MKKYFSIVCLVFILSSYVGLGFLNVAQASCNYIVRFQAQPKNITSTDSISLFTQVSRSGTECKEGVYLQYFVKVKNVATPSQYGMVNTPGTGEKRLNGEFNNFARFTSSGARSEELASDNFQFNLSNFIFGDLENSNQFPVFVKVVGTNALAGRIVSSNILTVSATENINISGTSGPTILSGVTNVKIDFNASTYYPPAYLNNLNPTGSRGDVSAETASNINLSIVEVGIKLENTNNLSPNLLVKTYVGSREVGSMEKTKAELAYRQIQKINVEENGYFKNGLNDVKVVVLNKNNITVKYAEGNAKVNIEGLKSGGGGSTGTGAGAGGNVGANTGAGNSGAGAGTVDTSLKETLFNPLPSDSLTGTLLGIAKGFLAVVGLWGVVFVMIGGFKMVIANGNEEAITAAKKTITWAVLGVVVALLSFSIIAIVQNLLGANIPEPEAINIIKPNKHV